MVKPRTKQDEKDELKRFLAEVLFEMIEQQVKQKAATAKMTALKK